MRMRIRISFFLLDLNLRNQYSSLRSYLLTSDA
jgi:hypothetical protein